MQIITSVLRASRSDSQPQLISIHRDTVDRVSLAL